MALLPIIDFTWARDPKGYRLSDAGPLRRLIRNGPNRTDVQCPILSGEEFRIFASIATTDAGLLEFANRYGPLTWSGFDAEQGDLVHLVTMQARRMKELLNASSGHAPVLDGSPAVFYPESTVYATVVWDPANKGLRWQFRPNTLLDALWLQFGQAVTRGAQIRACEHCGAWFEAGAGMGRRADARFCSDEHRVTYNSLKRNKGA